MNKIKFFHIADLHLGSYREDKLQSLNFETFVKLIDNAIHENIDFLLIAGDVFNSPLPKIDLVDDFIKQINRLRKQNIKIYVIGGSHDYSLLGKSFINIFNTSGIIKDVCRYNVMKDEKIELIKTSNQDLKINIYGILGRRNQLEENIFKNIMPLSLNKDYFNIFMFHTTIEELVKDDKYNFKKNFLSILPKGFNYYAGGHIHKNIIVNEQDFVISYSGALFPNNFTELKTLKPSYNCCEYDFNDKKLIVKHKEINTYDTMHILVEINNNTPIEAKNILIDSIPIKEVAGKIILLEIKGVVDGKISDIDINNVVEKIYIHNALIVLKNTSNLKSSLSQDIDKENICIDNSKIEQDMVNKYINDYDELKIVENLLQLNLEQLEEETKKQYNQRVLEMIKKVFQ